MSINPVLVFANTDRTVMVHYYPDLDDQVQVYAGTDYDDGCGLVTRDEIVELRDALTELLEVIK